MRQIVSILLAVGVFAATFFIASLLSQQTLSVKVAGLSLTGTIPGLVLAAAFAVMSYRGNGAKA
jgi:ABC-type transport system involved in multi-copper enzyme maturation permease subunit